MPANLSYQICNFIEKHNLLTHGDKIIVGLSGGPDSIFLLYFLHKIAQDLNLTLIGAHLDHGWRDDSVKDVLFCRQVCDDLKVKFIGNHLKDLSLNTMKGSLEEQGRHARRFFFEKIANNLNATKIALGHHLQDQQETFFIRLIRGTGLSGLTGMKPRNGMYIRPLLEVSKTLILNSLHDRNIAYLSDPTNQSPLFLRNSIRLHALPALKKCDERFDQNLLHAMHNLAQADEYLDLQSQELFKQVTTPTGDLICTSLVALHPIMQYRVLLLWIISNHVPFTPSQAIMKEIIRFLSCPRGGTHAVHPSWSLVKRKGHVSVCKSNQEQ